MSMEDLRKKMENNPNWDKTGDRQLDVVFANELPLFFEPPDEILEGILTAGDGSVLYGASNSGKTFLAVDMSASISRGSDWLEGRKTEKGMVIYLAAESPASVRRRLQAYQKYHNVRLPNFAIVQNPIDLFSNDGDTNKIIDLVKRLEDERGCKARLIVGDTLARLSAGANESAGQDMGIVIKHFDTVRKKTGAHFMLIHHSGKNAEAGARGWSGVRAAVDTEIEITDSPTGRCIEITKQRDLDSNGKRIGFRLENVTLGKSKWGTLTGSCVVLPWDAPVKKAKILSGAAGALEEYLLGIDKKVPIIECVIHFKGRYHRTTIERALDKFVADGMCTKLYGILYKVDEKW